MSLDKVRLLDSTEEVKESKQVVIDTVEVTATFEFELIDGEIKDSQLKELYEFLKPKPVETLEA